jgi:hypothetical protein
MRRTFPFIGMLLRKHGSGLPAELLTSYTPGLRKLKYLWEDSYPSSSAARMFEAIKTDRKGPPAEHIALCWIT